MNFHQLTEVKADLALPVNKPTKADIILISTVFLISVFAIIYSSVYSSNTATGFDICVDGKLHSSYSFAELKNGEIIEIETEYGYNKFLYENNGIRCIETDCRDKIEIRAGRISKTNQVLVCLPHKLTVEITGKKNIDTVSY